MNTKKKKMNNIPDYKLCNHKWVKDEFYFDYYCEYCFVIQNEIEFEPYKKTKPSIPIWRKDHDRGRWTGYALDYFRGSYNDDWSDVAWKYIVEDIPNPFTWYEVYKQFQKYNSSEYWTGFGSFIGFRNPLNKTILYYCDKYTNYRLKNYRINYLYLIYKFTQLFGEPYDERFIPLKGTKGWIYRMDEWWKEFCAKEWFEFKVTRIYKIKWNRQKVLKKFHEPQVV